jgi:two-component system LytT family response regulator
MKVVLLDDELHCTQTLSLILEQNCPGVEIVGVFNHPAEALVFLRSNKIDVLFLDIEMPFMNGFKLLNRLQPISMHVVFTTAYDSYAIKAFKYSAFDYLLKPIDEVELVETVRRLADTNTDITQKIHLEHLLEIIKDKPQVPERIAFPTLEGLEFVAVEQILRCESSSNYTTIYLLNASAMVVCRTLKEIEELLPASLFLRVHNSHVINKRHIRKYIKGAGGSIKMSDNYEVPVSRLRRDQVLKELTNIKA